MTKTNTSALSVVRYDPSLKNEWNNLLIRSRNGVFLFDRNYMDYHADRFQDCSYLVLKNNRVEAVIPGNKAGDLFYSHQGLTYGGVVSTVNIGVVDMLEIFRCLNDCLRLEGCSAVIYKPVPSMYHQMPAEEDLYALFRNRARLVARQVSSSILQARALPFIESRKCGVRKAVRSGLQVLESDEYAAFWPILGDVLKAKYGATPVHSVEEITLLHHRFPKQIRLHVASLGCQVVAGVVMYVHDRVAHVQYIATSEEGKRHGALDLMFEYLVHEIYSGIHVFDFGTSTEQGGYVLNESLIFQKEGFGGRGIVYDTYEYAL